MWDMLHVSTVLVSDRFITTPGVEDEFAAAIILSCLDSACLEQTLVLHAQYCWHLLCCMGLTSTLALTNPALACSGLGLGTRAPMISRESSDSLLAATTFLSSVQKYRFDILGWCSDHRCFGRLLALLLGMSAEAASAEEAGLL